MSDSLRKRSLSESKSSKDGKSSPTDASKSPQDAQDAGRGPSESQRANKHFEKHWSSRLVGGILPFDFWRKAPLVGRTDDHWFVRLPLWAQSTILIFTIGFLSLLILLLVSAIQVWSYSLSLMKQRLATSAGMAALSLEQQFGSLDSDVLTAMSHRSVLNFVQASNRGEVTPDEWNLMDDHLNVDVFLSKQVVSTQIYDKNFNPIYSFLQRSSSKSRLGQQNNLLPRKMYPMSYETGINETMAFLGNGYPTVMSNLTTTISNATDTNLVFSVTFALSSVPQSNTVISVSQGRNLTLIEGYATVVYSVPLTAQYLSATSFKHSITSVVRERDIHFDDDSSSKGHFSFLFRIPDFESSRAPRNYPIHSMPALLSAHGMALDALVQDGSYNGTNSTSIVDGTPNNVKHPNSNRYQFTDPGIHMKADSRARNSSLAESNTTNSTNGTNSTNSSSGHPNSNPFAGLEPPYIALDGRQGKSMDAVMRSHSPDNMSISVGYSYANIMGDRWLVFMTIQESEAYNDTRVLRNKLIGVAVGILGAVLLMVLPLSIWQTRGFYVVYQNMKLRPMFITEEFDKDGAGDTNPANGDNAESNKQPGEAGNPDGSNVPSPNGSDPRRIKEVNEEELGDGNETAVHTPRSTQGNNSGIIATVKRNVSNASRISSKSGRNSLPSQGKRTTSGSNSNREDFVDTEQGLVPSHIPRDLSPTGSSPSSTASEKDLFASHFDGPREYRYAIPLPLPKLNRWYTDETDDLVETYNDMVERLNEQYFHLEDQVRSRTREAQEARELREQANAAKSEFIAIITHELRTPLNGIMGLTTVSAEEKDPSKISDALRLIIESGHVLMALLNELLELSKSLIGVEPNITEFDTRKLMETLSTLFVSRMGQLSVTFALAAVPQQLNSLTLKGDMDHTVQVCLSIMSNAMKFSPDGGNVSVITHLKPLANDPYVKLDPYEGKLEEANCLLEILITDSGVGISPQHLARMFDLFVQGDDPLRKNHQGAGLGMAFSKHLSEGIGGYVTVYSAKDVGSTVVVRVPVAVINTTPEQIKQCLGPPIEFKVSNVYKTTSVNAGEVDPVPVPSHPPSRTGTDEERLTPKNSALAPPHSRRSKHAHHLSNGSKMLLTKAQPVAKLLSHGGSWHGHHHSEASKFSETSKQSESSQFSSSVLSSQTHSPRTHIIHSSSESSAVDTSPEEGQIAARTSLGIHSNHSTGSLLLNLPEDLFTPDRRSASPPQDHRNVNTISDQDSSRRPRPAQLMIPSRNVGGQYVRTETSGESSGQPDSSPSEKYPALMITPSPTVSPAEEEKPRDMRILLAEDNMLNQSIMIKMLKQLGITHIDTATDGESVIKLVEDSIVGGFHYGLIFMDLSMPGKSGIEATHHIRGTLGYPYPIVALTGFADMETRTACMEANIQEVLTKPVLRHDLLRVLQKYKKPI